MKSLWKTPYAWIGGWTSKGLGGFKRTAGTLLRTAADYKYQIAAVLVLATISAALVILLEPPEWVPKVGKAGVLLGSLLGAQAAIAAFTLAVTLFVMQAISNRPDADDQTYHEYIRRSWVGGVLRFSLMAVGITGAVLLVDTFGGGCSTRGFSSHRATYLGVRRCFCFCTQPVTGRSTIRTIPPSLASRTVDYFAERCKQNGRPSRNSGVRAPPPPGRGRYRG